MTDKLKARIEAQIQEDRQTALVSIEVYVFS